MIQAVNDHCVVEIEKNKYGNFVSNEAPKGFESGVLVSVSGLMPFFGGNSFVFQESLLDGDKISAIQSMYEPLIGKTVYWPEYSDRGVIIEHEDKTYCLMKLSLLTAYNDEGDK